MCAIIFLLNGADYALKASKITLQCYKIKKMLLESRIPVHKIVFAKEQPALGESSRNHNALHRKLLSPRPYFPCSVIELGTSSLVYFTAGFY